MRLGVWEIALILVLVLVLFGGGKLAGVGKALGKSIREFKSEMKQDEAEQAAGEGHEGVLEDPAGDHRVTDGQGQGSQDRDKAQ